MGAKVSIVIVSWNTREQLARCLQSIRLESGRLQSTAVETVVVDNASSDGSAEMVATHFPDVVLDRNHVNAGFARATNRAIEATNGRYVWLVNPDCELREGALEALLNFMEATPKCAAAGSRLVNPDGTLQVSAFPVLSLAREFWRLFHLDKLYPLARYPLNRWKWDEPHVVGAVQGASMMLRRSALNETGLLNPDYFIYTEEIDLCYRMANAGWEIYWVPTSEVLHLGGQSTSQVPEEMFLQLYRSKIQFFRFHRRRRAVLCYKAILALASIPRVALAPAAVLAIRLGLAEPRANTTKYAKLLAALPAL